MAWTAPPSFGATDTPTAAQLNAINDDFAVLHDPPRVRVSHPSNTSTSSGTATEITFSVQWYDTDAMWEGVSNPKRVTFKTAGSYWIFGNAVWAAATAGRRAGWLELNATTVLFAEEHGQHYATPPNIRIAHNPRGSYAFALNDFIRFRILQTSGSSLIIASDPMGPVMGAHWIGGT